MDLYNVPGVTGYLTLNSDGAVLASGGDLDNDERTANILYGLLGLANDRLDPAAFDQGFKRLSVTYEDHAYVVCLSNRKVIILMGGISFSMYQLYELIQEMESPSAVADSQPKLYNF